MHICMYFDYNIKFTNKYTYTNEEGDFSRGCESYIKNINGGELIEMLASFFGRTEFSSIDINDNTILINMFDPTTGETENITICVEE